ncbi:amidohydrolase family protein [Nocardia sp. NPDC001965]
MLYNARLVDGRGGDPVPDAAVVIRDGRFTWAGRRGDEPEPVAGEARVDLRGNTICPGFFDCHVHFALPGTKGTLYDGLAQPASYRTLTVLERLRVTLRNGVTTARDLMGIDTGFRDAVAHGLIEGPRLLVAINMLSQTAGHGDFTLRSGFDPTPYLAAPEAPPFRVDSVDEIRATVRRLIALGADVIKVATSGGVATPNDQPEWLGMRTELVRAAVEEGIAYGGVPVAAHAIGYAGIRAAIEAGVRSIEHGYALDNELRRRMVDQGTFLVPTLLETVHDLDPARTSAVAAHKSVHWHEVAQQAVGESAAAGVAIALGTDAGLGPDHGTNLAELGLLVRFGGLTPGEAIVAGTRTAARLCGVEEHLGTVEAGKIADVVVVAGDPLADIGELGNPDKILLVVKDGVPVVDRAGFLPAATPPG